MENTKFNSITRYVLVNLEGKDNRVSVHLTKEDAEKFAKDNGFEHYYISETVVSLTDQEISKMEDYRTISWMAGEVQSRVRLGIDNEVPSDEVAMEIGGHAYGLYCCNEVTNQGLKMEDCTQGECINQAVEDYCDDHDIDCWEV